MIPWDHLPISFLRTLSATVSSFLDQSTTSFLGSFTSQLLSLISENFLVAARSTRFSDSGSRKFLVLTHRRGTRLRSSSRSLLAKLVSLGGCTGVLLLPVGELVVAHLVKLFPSIFAEEHRKGLHNYAIFLLFIFFLACFSIFNISAVVPVI